MRATIVTAVLALGAGLFIACSALADPSRPGGETTTTVQGANAFSQPAANLSFDDRLNFSVGNSFFRNPWVAAPATTEARDGLGPMFNTNSCQGCHIKDGRGHPPEEGQSNLVSTLVRLSIPATKERPRQIHESVIAEPTYGDQAQDFAIAGVTPEMRIIWHWDKVDMPLVNGDTVELRKPRLEFTDLASGDLHPDVMISPRVAPAMIGLGLLETIPEEAIRAKADPDDDNNDGISGRPNEVWDQRSNSLTLGRFGWKAGKPTVEQQSAGAFFGDMGLTSSLNPDNPCSESQTECRMAPHGGTPEVSDETLEFVAFYSSHLAVPARPNAMDENILAGQALFADMGCADCHQPSWQTGDSESAALANQTIYPYTDLLLHDMGEGLADHRPEFEANGREWRTAPLWGLGDYQDVNGHTQLLHDGRARNITEAILWHGGEAADSRDRFVKLADEPKKHLLDFLNSL
jgi:CxxC motif-containing protein (DUF1111 family)